MQNETKTTSMSGQETKARQKRTFTFPPQDGMGEPVQVEADTIEEAETKFKETIKTINA